MNDYELENMIEEDEQEDLGNTNITLSSKEKIHLKNEDKKTTKENPIFYVGITEKSKEQEARDKKQNKYQERREELYKKEKWCNLPLSSAMSLWFIPIYKYANDLAILARELGDDFENDEEFKFQLANGRNACAKGGMWHFFDILFYHHMETKLLYSQVKEQNTTKEQSLQYKKKIENLEADIYAQSYAVNKSKMDYDLKDNQVICLKDEIQYFLSIIKEKEAQFIKYKESVCDFVEERLTYQAKIQQLEEQIETQNIMLAAKEKSIGEEKSITNEQKSNTMLLDFDDDLFLPIDSMNSKKFLKIMDDYFDDYEEAEEEANSLESEPNLSKVEEEIVETTTVPENNDVENKEKDLSARKYIGRTSHLKKAEYEEAKKLKAEGKTYKKLFKQFGFASEKSMRNAFSKGITRFRDSK